MSLRNLVSLGKFKDRYNVDSGEEVKKVLDNFFIPALSNSHTYDRQAGYFSSAIFSITYQALPKFIKNGGKMRIICNEFLTKEDIAAGKDISSQEQFNDELHYLLENFQHHKRTQLLCSLIKQGVLEMKICWKHQPGLFHEKTGIFQDNEGTTVTFNGGVNESLGGWLSNYDSMTLEQSGGTGRKNVIEDQIKDFDKLWKNSHDMWQCVSLDKAIKNNIIKNAFDAKDFDRELDEIIRIEDSLKDILAKNNTLTFEDIKSIHRSRKDASPLDGVTLMDHQKLAINSWRANDNRAILKYCTGAGKTMIAMFAIREMLAKNKKPLIILDGLTLRKQWEIEIRKFVTNNVFIAQGKNITEQLSAVSKDDGKDIVILVCEQSAKTQNFLNNFTIGEHIFLVADECHCLWADGANRIIQQNWNNCPRLGLSATPEDTSFDPFNKKSENTVDVVEFFGGKKMPDDTYKFTESFTIRQAITAKPPVLTKYYYYPISVTLNDLEMREYISLTKRIIFKSHSIDKNNKEDREKLQMLMIERARIIKNAENKQQKCIEIITSKAYKSHVINPERQSWLIYVGAGKGTDKEDEKRQIETYKELINESMPGVNVIAYFSDKVKSKDRKKTLDDFKNTQGILIGCQMLDQGIDIPQLSMGIILASSKNERTFVQRRGRLLRIDRSNKFYKKKHAVIFDIIVVPNFRSYNNDSEEQDFISMFEGECNRAMQFAADAENDVESLNELDIIRNKLRARIS